VVGGSSIQTINCVSSLRWAASYHEKPSLSWIEYEEYSEFHPTYKNGDGSQHSLPVPQTIAARFATWQNAVKAAGLQTATNERVSEKFSKDMLSQKPFKMQPIIIIESR
jgi:hypothetical protein